MANNRQALKVALVGGGKIAQYHLSVLADTTAATVVALVDSNPQTLEETAARFAIPERYPCHAELLEKNRPDAAFVLVNAQHMAAVAADFLQAGIPTFLEKPPGIYTAQTRQLAAIAAQTGTLAMVGVNRRFYSTLIAGREKLLQLGPVHSLTVEAHEDIGRLGEDPKFPPEVVRRWSAANGIHALDTLRFFAGDIARITAFHRVVEGPMPDCNSAFIEFEQGAVGRAHMDWFGPGAHRFEVRTRDATLTSGPYFSTLELQRRGGAPETIALDAIDQQYKPGFWRQDQTFLECVRAGKPLPDPACDLEDAIKTMELIDAISGTQDES